MYRPAQTKPITKERAREQELMTYQEELTNQLHPLEERTETTPTHQPRILTQEDRDLLAQYDWEYYDQTAKLRRLEATNRNTKQTASLEKITEKTPELEKRIENNEPTLGQTLSQIPKVIGGITYAGLSLATLPLIIPTRARRAFDWIENKKPITSPLQRIEEGTTMIGACIGCLGLLGIVGSYGLALIPSAKGVKYLIDNYPSSMLTFLATNVASGIYEIARANIAIRQKQISSL